MPIVHLHHPHSDLHSLAESGALRFRTQDEASVARRRLNSLTWRQARAGREVRRLSTAAANVSDLDTSHTLLRQRDVAVGKMTRAVHNIAALRGNQENPRR